MDGRIAHLRSHYRLAGAQVAAPALALRLDRVLRDDVIRNYDEALKSALAGDESVYVLRRVKTNLRVILNPDATDTALAKTWGSNLAAAVIRAIAKGEDEPGNLVRFENQADYVASFLVALLKGTQKGEWYYEAFAEFTSLDQKTAISRVLLENSAHLPAILGYVHRSGQLDSLIARLDVETKRTLWFPESEQRDDLEVNRSLFTTALQFLDKLNDWAHVPKNGDELFRSYWETAPPFADWRDPRSLAESVFEVVRFLFLRGYLGKRSQPAEVLSVGLGKALEEFEWLDREWLKSAVLELFERSDQTPVDLPLRTSSGRATPRQQELLSAIAAALSDVSVVGGDPLATSLKILAMLIDAAPGWADDTAAKVMIENLIAAQVAMQDASSSAEFVKRLQGRDVEGALTLLPIEKRERARDTCRAIASLGEPALALVEKLSTENGVQPLTGGVESDCAGLSLLLRAVLDSRLHTLAEETSYPAESEWPRSVMLFLLVALRLCGESALTSDRLDEGLCLLAGMNHSPEMDAIRDCWSKSETADHGKFQQALLSVAAGQRLLEPATMHVFQIDWADGKRAIVAADESEFIWPFATVIDTDEDVATTVSNWQTAWEGATGVKPRVVVDDCVKARNEFLDALQVLGQGETGNPNLDLTSSIIACLLLRLWARWLRGFSTSSIPFLVENFIQRPGRLWTHSEELLVELDRGPLDLIMEMAGYLSDLERVPWLPGGRIRFLLKGV